MSCMRLEGMIFDLDGTLTDTFAVCFISFRETIQAVTDRCPTDDEIFAHFGPSEEGMFRRWVPDRWEHCLRLYLSLYEREHRRIGRIFPGVETALQTLKALGIPMAVVTGKGPRSTAISLAQLGLTPYFDSIQTGSPEGNVKPQGIQRVLTRWGAAPERVAYLGDVASDIEAAHAVGVMPLAAAWEARSDTAALRALRPLAMFTAVAQFLEWVDTVVDPRKGGT
jgi:pyrophosphatase PpaX